MTIRVKRGTEVGEAAIRVQRYYAHTYTRFGGLVYAMEVFDEHRALHTTLGESIYAGPEAATEAGPLALTRLSPKVYTIAWSEGQDVSDLRNTLRTALQDGTIPESWLVEVNAASTLLTITDPSVYAQPNDGVLYETIVDSMDWPERDNYLPHPTRGA